MGQRDTILIVDDMEINRVILSGLFQNEYHLLEAENGEQALLLLKQCHSNIAIVLMDVIMPVMDGYQVMREMGAGGFLTEVPVVVITADNSLESELRSFDLGASDIIVKPFEPHVVKRRVHNIIELYLHKHNLEDMVDRQACKLKESNDVLVDVLSSVIESRSQETGQHIKRMRLLTGVLLEELSRNCPEYGLDQHKIEVISSASALHDIGKIAIEDKILNKPGRLTPEEFEIMKTHTTKGCKILESLERMSDKEYLQYAYNICRYHHERWDGRGYPEGLCGDAIPICAQAVSVVDAYDALTSDRVYKKAVPHRQAVNMILNGECGMFSPRLLECFKTAQPVLAVVCSKYADSKTPPASPLSGKAPEMISVNYNVSALQMEQMKYLAMLRYENTMVVEADFSSGSYHLVYAPNLRIKRVFQGKGLDDALRHYIAEMVMPEDRESMERAWDRDIPGFFEEGMLKQSWMHRLRDGLAYDWYELTILRIDIEHPRQRKALLLWKAQKQDPALISAQGLEVRRSGENHAGDLEILHNILKGIFRCRNDKWFTIMEIDDGFMGYERNEIRERFHDRYLEIIHPDDRDRVKKELPAQLGKGNDYELTYRIWDRDGESSWVLSKGSLVTDGNGQECLYSVIIDITQTKRAQEELRLGLERYKIVMEQTNDVFFEWDIGTDTVEYSPNWQGRFGYGIVTTKISERIPKISHLHPEDMDSFGELMRKIRSGVKYSELEFRVSDARGRYQWCKMRATTQFDDQGRACKAIGIVIDINDEKLAAQELKAMAERDTLTKLYNKASARQRIEAMLLTRSLEEKSALFIIDIDNFKTVNNRYGHMFGDAVLTKLASRLSRLFGSGDLVSRIGGDEFMALYQGAFGNGQVKAAADRILACFEQVFDELPSECGISSSIGIAVCPRDGEDFQTLFWRADAALSHAKAMGKKQYRIYNRSMDYRAYGHNAVRQTAAGTAIESGGGSGAVLNDLLPKVFNILNGAGQTDGAVEKVLKLLGERLQVSRAYVFENSEDNQRCSNTFEWCAPGVESQKDKMQNMVYSDLRSDYRSYFNEKGILYCDDAETFPGDIREAFKLREVKSVFQCAIKDNGVFRGWVGFDSHSFQYLLTDKQIEEISFISGLLSLFLLKRQAQNRLACGG